MGNYAKLLTFEIQKCGQILCANKPYFLMLDHISWNSLISGTLEMGALDNLLYFTALDMPCLLMEVRIAIEHSRGRGYNPRLMSSFGALQRYHCVKPTFTQC